MTYEELAQYDGRDGQPAYVAISGTIYDVSDSPLWKNGNHEDAHQAGTDLTEALKTAPHVASVIERFPSVGRIDPSPAEASPQSTKHWILIAIIALLIIAGWALTR